MNEKCNNVNKRNNNLDKNQLEGEEDDEEEEEDGEEEEGEEEEDKNDSNMNNLEQSCEDGDEEEDEDELDDGENEQNLSILESYQEKINYFEDLKLFPRPKTNFILYKNSNNKNEYNPIQNNKDKIPSSRAYFTQNEELNSSIKLIRLSHHIIPYNYKEYNKGLNIFGINVEPFYFVDSENEQEFFDEIFIKGDNILKCKYCNAYYNKISFNYEKISSINNYHNNKAFCFNCKKNFNFYTSDNNFPEKTTDNNNFYTIPDFKSNRPSISYLIDAENNNSYIRYTIEFIALDLTNKTL